VQTSGHTCDHFSILTEVKKELFSCVPYRGKSESPGKRPDSVSLSLEVSGSGFIHVIANPSHLCVGCGKQCFTPLVPDESRIKTTTL